MASVIDKLNDEQKKPAVVTDCPVLVTAGAGSGKTRLLTHRIAYLIKEQNVNPKNILAITFTNKAANEMKSRIIDLIDDVNVSDMWVCTFHSMCGKMLRLNADRVGLTSSFSIYGDSEKERLVKRLLKEHPRFMQLEKNELKPETVEFHISNAKNELKSPDEYAVLIKDKKNSDIIIDVYKRYQKEMLMCNAVDFDDMLVKAYELLVNNPDIKEIYQTKFKYIHVDEFQDTNVVQYELVKLLGEKYNNVFAVGDEDQCIYSWRGAKFTNVSKFIQDNANIKIFKLEQNYRSTKSIIKVSNNIIKNNKNRIDKNLWTDNDKGSEVKIFTAYSDLEEAEFVATKIKKLVTEDNYKYNDFAVLMRISSLSRVIEEKFLNYNIPYKVYGGFKFFERKEVKDALSYLKVISNPKDNDSFLRVLAFPKKGIGESTINKLQTVANEQGISLFETTKFGVNVDDAIIKKLSPIIDQLQYFIDKKETTSISKLFTELIDEFGVKTAFSKSIEEEFTKILNIETLEHSVLEFEQANEGATLDDYLQSVTLSRDIDDLDETENCVTIMTIHAAKGLEFNSVFIIGLIEGVLPLSRAIFSVDENELEEERRLMYVASTRAMKELCYSRPTSKFSFETRRTEATSASRFLKEAGIVGIESTPRKANDYYDSYNYNGDYRFYNKSNSDNYNAKGADYVGVSSYEPDDSKPISSVSTDKINEYKKYTVGTKVMHKSFGEGEVVLPVTDMVGAFITIKFKSVGNKTLSLKFAPLTIIKE